MNSNININKTANSIYSWTINFFQTEESILSDCSLNSTLNFTSEHECIEHLKETTKKLFPKLELVLTEFKE